jgi:hypothetical protein
MEKRMVKQNIMKKILLIILVFISLSSFGQSDSLMNTYKDNPITFKIPVKGVILYAYYFQQNFDWKNRLAPDSYKPIIGSGTQLDSVVTVTTTADQLSSFVIHVIAERYGAIYNTAQSIFYNNPVITGYTGLFIQITNIANGTGSQKNAASYVIYKYNQYTQTMTDLTNQMMSTGLYWIQH